MPFAKEKDALGPAARIGRIRLRRACRRGAGAVELVVVLVIVLLVGLMVLAALPRGRENARIVGCQENLRQIGAALALYQQADGGLPSVPDLGSSPAAEGSSPLGAMLDELGLFDFSGLRDPKHRPARQADVPLDERPIPGFVCPSDPIAATNLFPAPVSYRASTGDTSTGSTGAFAPGRKVKIADVQQADGLSYTAAFAERLVGTGEPESSPRNYRSTPGPIGAICPPGSTSPRDWWGNAGKSWVTPDWVSSLYTHAQPPGVSTSCIATDGRSALMGSSSGHVNRIHVLLLDGSVRPFTPRVDAKLWRSLGNIDDSAKIPGSSATALPVQDHESGPEAEPQKP